jgi:hypothetical protein
VLLQAIGELTVAASRLAYLIASARDEDEAWLRKTLASVGGPRRELAALVELVRHDPATRRLRRLQHEVTFLLEERGALVHSVGMWEVTDPAKPAPLFWHPRTDTEATITVEQVRERAQQLKLATGHAIRARRGGLLLQYST